MCSSVVVVCRILLLFVVLPCNMAKKERIVNVKLSEKHKDSADYHSEAFLGKEDAKMFKGLSPEETSRRLGLIFEKIDTDKDGIVHEGELEKWITTSQERYVREDTEREFAKFDENKDGQVKWDEYYKITFGFLKDDNDWKVGEAQGFSYKDMFGRDRKRWKVADKDGDDSCTKEEFKAYSHPEEFVYMRGIVLDETMADMDVNQDGFLDLEEYLNDVYVPQHPGETEPDWVVTEREFFVMHRDKDKDGRLSKEEVRQWILPDDSNHSKAEAKHLIYESDVDRDGVLTKKEMLDNVETFVGSLATEWGKFFQRHDEF